MAIGRTTIPLLLLASIVGVAGCGNTHDAFLPAVDVVPQLARPPNAAGPICVALGPGVADALQLGEVTKNLVGETSWDDFAVIHLSRLREGFVRGAEHAGDSSPIVECGQEHRHRIEFRRVALTRSPYGFHYVLAYDADVTDQRSRTHARFSGQIAGADEVGVGGSMEAFAVSELFARAVEEMAQRAGLGLPLEDGFRGDVIWNYRQARAPWDVMRRPEATRCAVHLSSKEEVPSGAVPFGDLFVVADRRVRARLENVAALYPRVRRAAAAAGATHFVILEIDEPMHLLKLRVALYGPFRRDPHAPTDCPPKSPADAIVDRPVKK